MGFFLFPRPQAQDGMSDILPESFFIFVDFKKYENGRVSEIH